MHEQLVNGLGTVISRLERMEQDQQGVVERVTQLEELESSPSGDNSNPALDHSLDPFANIDLNDQVDKKSSSRKSRSRRSFLAQEHEEYVSQEQEDDHEQWLGTLKSEFRLNGFKHIFSDQESVWQNCKQKKPKKADSSSRGNSKICGMTKRNSSLPQAERTKWTSIFSSLELGLGPDEDLRVREVHEHIQKEIDAHAQTSSGIMDNMKGRSMQQHDEQKPPKNCTCGLLLSHAGTQGTRPSQRE